MGLPSGSRLLFSLGNATVYEYEGSVGSELYTDIYGVQGSNATLLLHLTGLGGVADAVAMPGLGTGIFVAPNSQGDGATVYGTNGTSSGTQALLITPQGNGVASAANYFVADAFATVFQVLITRVINNTISYETKIYETNGLGSGTDLEWDLTNTYGLGSSPLPNPLVSQGNAITLTAGQTGSISGVSVLEINTASNIISVTITANGGTVTTSGGTVSGAGTSMMTVSGTWSQVNSDLAALTFTAGPHLGGGSISVVASYAGHVSPAESSAVTITGSSPVVTQQIPNQTWSQGQSLSFRLPADIFSDPQGEPLTYRAMLSDGSALPDWLSFDAGTMTFAGTVPGGIQTLSISVTATDTSALVGAETFSVTVPPAAPKISQQTPDQVWSPGQSVSFQLAANTFRDPQNEALTYTAHLGSDSTLPVWLTFNATTRTFTGIVPGGAQTLSISVTATDTSLLSDTETFSVTVPAAAPYIADQTPDQIWSPGQKISLQLAADTFTDPQNETLAYSATLSDGASLPAWLTFDTATKTFTGTVPAGAQSLSIKVSVTDTSGLSASESFAGSVQNNNPRIMIWSGAQDGYFSDPDNWDDVTNGLDPALMAPGPLDTVDFLSGAGTIVGTGSASLLQISGDSVWNFSSGAVLDLDTGLVVGQSGTGSLTVGSQSTVTVGGSTASVSQGLDVAQGDGSTGEITVTGSQSLLMNAGDFIVGDGGLGSVAIQSGGTVITVAGTLAGLVIASTASSSGASIEVAGVGSTLRASGPMVVGAGGSGSLSLTQGASVSASSLDEAADAGGAGQISIVGIGSDLSVAGTATIADLSPATLAILNGGSFQAGYVNLGVGAATGAITVAGPGTDFNVTLGMTVGGNGIFSIGNDVTVFIDGAFNEIGAVNQGSGSLIDPSTVTNSSPHGGGGGSGETASTSISNDSTFFVGDQFNGAYTLTTPLITGTGVLQADPATNAGAEPDLVLNAGSIGSGQTLAFGGGPAEITLGSDSGTMAIAGLAAGIGSFVSGDTIVVTTTAAAHFVLNGSVVAVVDAVGGGTEGTLAFANATLAGTAADTAGALVDQVACFAAGTRIETEHGLVAVEDLRVGDRVITVDGVAEPVVWIGQKTIDCARRRRPREVWPVRVARASFGANVPLRELYLSPDHAVFLDGVLVPVRLLIDGEAIAQVAWPRVTYFHVELPRHAVILAEGLTVESYLDVGDHHRGVADGRRRARHAGAATRWEAAGCAPLILTGAALASARATQRQTVAP